METFKMVYLYQKKEYLTYLIKSPENTLKLNKKMAKRGNVQRVLQLFVTISGSYFTADEYFLPHFPAKGKRGADLLPQDVGLARPCLQRGSATNAGDICCARLNHMPLLLLLFSNKLHRFSTTSLFLARLRQTALIPRQ